MNKLARLIRDRLAALRRPASRPAARPRLEVLEDRLAPSAVGTVGGPLVLQRPAVLAGDFDGDGKADAARMTATGIWQVGLSQGPYFHMSFWGNWGSRAGWRTLLVGDFNGDGKDDVAGLNRQGRWIVGISDGTEFNTQAWGRWGHGVGWAQILVGDFNGDGRDDVAGLSAGGGLTVARSTGTGFTSRLWDTWRPATRWADLVVGDFNGDGRADLAGLSRSGFWTVAVSHGTSFRSRGWGNGGSPGRWANVQVGDFNGDGRDDVATFSRSGLWVVRLSAGVQFDPARWASWGPSVHWVDAEVGDFNGDGTADLAGLTRDGHWVVGLSRGDAFDAAIWDRWRSTPRGARFLAGGFTGVGDAIAGFFRDGTWVVLGSDGQSIHSQVFGQWPLGADGAVYPGDVAPFMRGVRWLYSRRFINPQAPGLLRSMYFNSPRGYLTFVENFKGVLRSWVKEADLAGIRDDAGMNEFLRRHLDEHFARTRRVLAGFYPGLSARTLRLLMAMNLAHAHLRYATVEDTGASVWRTLHLRAGDCTEIADVEAALVRAMGYPARKLALSDRFRTPQGPFLSSHEVVYVQNLWLDAEINAALGVNLRRLRHVRPDRRLQNLVNHRQVFGFYNWYLKPDVRAAQLAHRLDGGIITFYYKYYLQGIGSGSSRLYFSQG